MHYPLFRVSVGKVSPFLVTPSWLEVEDARLLFQLDFLKILFIFFLEERGERERERNIHVRNIDQLLLACSQPGSWPTTQACALTRGPFGLQDNAQPTEPHQSGLN